MTERAHGENVIRRSLFLAVLTLGLGTQAPASAQFPDLTEASGRYQDPIERAAADYNRGAHTMKKAEKQRAAEESNS